MTTREIIDEDLCGQCSNCSLMEPRKSYRPGSPPATKHELWHAKALCIAGWPINRTFHDAITGCDRFEPEHSA